MDKPVIAFLTMKGGVGKTTLAANITRSLADIQKRKILLIDADSQCNLSQVFLESDAIEAPRGRSLSQAFETNGRPLYAGDLRETLYPKAPFVSATGSNIDFIVGSFDTFELNATATAGRREAARERFKDFIDQAKREYDLIAIDTNPSATFVTMQVLANANFLVAPITFDAFSLQGIHLVVHHLKQTYPWLDTPDRLCLVANKVPRSPSDSELRRLENEEDKIKQKYPRLARSIKLERIHRSDLIANRAAAKGFLADNNGVKGGIYDRVVTDFTEVAKAINMDLHHVFDAPATEKQEPTETTGWSTLKGWLGLSLDRH
jgi:chromosome partitioning protein